MSRRNQRGQALVEFAFTVPVATLLLLGVFQFGAALNQYDMVDNAARIGTRYAIVHGSTCTMSDCPATSSTISQYVIAHSAGMLNGSSPMTVTVSWPGGGASNCTSGSQASQCPVEVTVKSTFKFISFGKFAVSIPMSSTSEMVISQ